MMRALIVMTLGVIVGWTHGVHADAPAADADALFRQGKSRLAVLDYEHACPLLAESFRIDPATGTLLALAICHERQGQVTVALDAYREVARRAEAEGRSDRVEAARQRIAALEVALARGGSSAAAGEAATPATSADASATPSDTSGTTNASGTSDATDATATPNTDEAAAAVPVAVTTPVDTEPVHAPEISPASTRTTAHRARPTHAPAQTGSSMWRTTGWITLGVGVAALVSGSAFALQAVRKNNESHAHCAVNRCDATGVDARNEARAWGTAASVSLTVGAVLAAGGVALVLWGPDQAEDRAHARLLPVVGADGLGAMATGAF